MNLEVLKTAVTSKVGMAVLTTKSHSPAILFGAGVIGVVATVIISSRATLHLDEVIDKHDEKVAEIHLAETEKKNYTSRMAKADLLTVKTHLVLDLAKLYGPAVVLGALSIGALGGSHYILSRRNAGLMAAFAAADRALKEYRARVIADVGAEKDREYMFGATEREIHMGETKKGEQKIARIKTFGDGGSPYSRIFARGNPNFQFTPEYNVFFLRLTQNHLNDQLRARGHVFLNDVYRELGFQDTEEGAVTGWLRDGDGDGYIDFSIWSDRNMEQMHQFVQGKDGALILDFNVDGPIFKKLRSPLKNRTD